MTCHTQITAIQNIIKHAHRNGKPLFMISTDIRKAFDTVAFEAFSFSIKSLGFSDRVRHILNNLQMDFTSVVRTPFGDSEKFMINQGCKQGCALSPLRFNLVYDIFLKYIENNNWGYKWKSSLRTNKFVKNIPGCAFVDDLLLISDTSEEFRKMVHCFSTFLWACGMALNPKKCHYTSVNSANPPTITLCDHLENFQNIQHRNAGIPFKYLGYLLIAKDYGTNVAKIWRPHNLLLYDKLMDKLDRLDPRRLHKGEVGRIINADVISVLNYFLNSNFIPIRRPTREQETTAVDCSLDSTYITSAHISDESKESELEEKTKGDEPTRRTKEDLEAPPCIFNFKDKIYKKLKQLYNLMPNQTKHVIFKNTGNTGMGIKNPEVINVSAKIGNLKQCLNSHSSVCAFTTRETIHDIFLHTGMDMGKNIETVPSYSSMHAFPAFYKEAAEGMRNSKIGMLLRDHLPPNKINITRMLSGTNLSEDRNLRLFLNDIPNNDLTRMIPSIFQHSIQQTNTDDTRNIFIRKFHGFLTNPENTSRQIKRLIKQDLENSITPHLAFLLGNKRWHTRVIVDACDSICKSLSLVKTNFSACPFDIDNHLSMCNLEHDSFKGRKFKKLSMSPGIHLVPNLNKLCYGVNKTIPDNMYVSDSTPRVHIGTDGSYDPNTNIAGAGFTTRETGPSYKGPELNNGRNDLSTSIPGKQTINRAEALAVIGVLRSAHNENIHLHLHVDSQVTIDGTMTLLSTPNTNRYIENYSLLKTISEFVHRRHMNNLDTLFSKVASHTNNDDKGSNLNRTADFLAKEGLKMTSSVFREPLFNLRTATLIIEGDVEEGKHYSTLMKFIDADIFSKYLASVSENPEDHTYTKYVHNYKLKGTWEKATARKRSIMDKVEVYGEILLAHACATPYNIQNTNNHKPKYRNVIFHNNQCLNCNKKEPGDEHHCLCRCPGFDHSVLITR